MKFKNFFAGILLCLLAAFVQAQPFQIRAVNKGNGFVGVEIKSTSNTILPTTDHSLTDLVFGLKWLSSYNVDLDGTISSGYNIVKSGVRLEKDGYHYQAFSAANTPFKFPSNWVLNEWVEIMSIRNTMTSTGVGIFEIVESDFDVSTDPNFGVGLVNDLTDYTLTVMGSAENVILPVTLLEFTATPISKIVHLKWSTTHEQNNKGFAVERADIQQANFKKIGWINSKESGSAINNYEFVDKEVAAGAKYYYRLKQIDMNERHKYSDVRTATLEKQDQKAAFRIMPNPVRQELNVYFNSTVHPETVLLKVVDAKGAVVVTRNHLMEKNSGVRINVSNLAKGYYVLIAEKNNNVVYSEAFQKQ